MKLYNDVRRTHVIFSSRQCFYKMNHKLSNIWDCGFLGKGCFSTFLGNLVFNTNTLFMFLKLLTKKELALNLFLPPFILKGGSFHNKKEI